MPVAAGLWIGGPAAASAAASAAPYLAYKLSSSALAAALARSLWKSLPAWIRDDPAFAKRGSLLRSSNFSWRDSSPNGANGNDAEALLPPGEAATEEMATLSDVISKLDGMATSAGKTIDTRLKPAQMHAAILAYVQLSNQLRTHCPEARDRLYEKCAIHRGDGDDDQSMSVHVTKEELRDLRQSLDFATWSYVDYYGTENVRAKLESVDGDYYLHSHSPNDANVPGKVGWFIALSPERKEIVIGAKGTSSFEDLITDAAGASTPFDMHADSGVGRTNSKTDNDWHCERMSIEVAVDHESIVVNSGNDNIGNTTSAGAPTETGEGIEVELRVEEESIMILADGSTVCCHEGVLISARRLLGDVREVVETLAVKSDYSLRIVGHSLGGGVAILLGILVRSIFPSLAERDAVRVHAFAPPPVLDIDGATGCEFFVTSVVNNADIIPRGSVANLAVLMELLRVIN